MPKAKILIVEDEKNIAEYLQNILEGLGYGGRVNLTQTAVSRALLRGVEVLKESEEFDDLLKKLLK